MWDELMETLARPLDGESVRRARELVAELLGGRDSLADDECGSRRLTLVILESLGEWLKGHEPCECECAGYFHSGVPGIIGRAGEAGAAIERCDACERYPSDEAAEVALAFGEGVFNE